MEKPSVAPPVAAIAGIAVLVGCVIPICVYSYWPRPPFSGYPAGSSEGVFFIPMLAPLLIVVIVVEFFLLSAVKNLFYPEFTSRLLSIYDFFTSIVIAIAIAIPIGIVGWLVLTMYGSPNSLDLRNPRVIDIAIISIIIAGAVPVVGFIVLARFIAARQRDRQLKPGEDTTIVQDENL